MDNAAKLEFYLRSFAFRWIDDFKERRFAKIKDAGDDIRREKIALRVVLRYAVVIILARKTDFILRGG